MHVDKVDRIAHALLHALDSATLLPLPTQADPAFDLAQAFVVADRLRELRLARGERTAGYKIGFTNRTIWPRYGVAAPIWAPVWRHTVTLLDRTDATLFLTGLSQPRIEPEIVFGLRAVPQPGMDDAALVGCLDWVAHGFEIVQTHFVDWKFTLPDCFVDGALHARLFVGPRVPIERFDDPVTELRALEVSLARDGAVVERGVGRNVLGGPVDALREWLDAMHAQPQPWPLHAGDLVTTGTLTDAWPLAAGQRWSTTLGDPRLQGLTLSTVG